MVTVLFAWLAALTWAAAMVCFGLAVRVRGDRRETDLAARRACNALTEARAVRDAVYDAHSKLTRLRDAYRTADKQLPEPRRVYCVDCRFHVKGGAFQDLSVCVAAPAGNGMFRVTGLSDTNAEHDCEHFQEKQPKEREHGNDRQDPV